MMPRRCRPVLAAWSSAFAGYRFPPEIIVLGVRWYPRYGLDVPRCRGAAARAGIEVDDVPVRRWVQRFTPKVIDAARPCRHAVADRWFMDATYDWVSSRRRYVYRAIDQCGQIIEVCVSPRRDLRATRRFFESAFTARGERRDGADNAPALARAIHELVRGAFHDTAQSRVRRKEH